ncbi:MAG: SdpI family protein [Candidatus Dojkabacteria bacterium]
MKNKALSLLPFLVVLGMFIAGIIIYPNLPDKVPSHWNINNEIDEYVKPFWGAFLLPILAAVIVTLMNYIPRFDPKVQNIKSFQPQFKVLIFIFALFFAYIYALTLIAAFKPELQVGSLMVPAMGVLFAYIGILLKDTKQNWFIGIRTPWTLSDATVWDKTHKLGSKLFIGAGVLSILTVFWQAASFYIVIGSILLATFVTILYSYLEFKKLARK